LNSLNPTIVKKILLLAIISIIIFSCKKDDPTDLSLEIKLTDEFGDSESQFSLNDSLIFEFLLSNHTGNEATYLRPCSEFGHFLHIYQEDPNGDFINFGHPEYNCADVAVYLNINDGETVLLGRIPWDSEHGWPEMMPGRYYVGDTLFLRINDRRYDFEERIYFEIDF
jgi:hypothetical protein